MLSTLPVIGRPDRYLEMWLSPRRIYQVFVNMGGFFRNLDPS